MSAFLKHRTTTIWLVLVVATLLAWLLGADHVLGDHTRLTTVLVLLVAFVKVRLIGLDFMELRTAPVPLRILFEGYVVVVLGAVVGTYLLA